MDNNNNNNNNDNSTTTRILKALSVLEQEAKFPLLVRNKIDELAGVFLEKVEEAVADLLCDTCAANYKGLDIDRDTEEEVEFAIRCFPEVVIGNYPNYPNSMQSLQLYSEKYGSTRINIKATPFVPLYVRLAIELGQDQFEEEERGGFLVQDTNGENILQLLVSRHNDSHDLDKEQKQLIDDQYLDVLKQLKEMNLLMKEDIQEYNLVLELCNNDSIFAEKTFQYLTDWDPKSLASLDSDGDLPLHIITAENSYIDGFRAVFNAGMRHFQNKKGIGFLFRKNDRGSTPFELAGDKYGEMEVKKVIESTLEDCSDNPYNTANALISAAIDENISLDGVYFILQREPDVLQKLISSSSGPSNQRKKRQRDEENDG